MAIKKIVLLRLLLTIICEVSFLYLLNWWSSAPLPTSEVDFSSLKKRNLVRYIKKNCPHFGNPKLKPEKLVNQATRCWREKRQLGDRSFAYNPEDLNEERLCEEILRHCRGKLKACPPTSKQDRIRTLENCFFDFIAITKFERGKLGQIQNIALHTSATGLAVFAYGCEPNPFLYNFWDRHHFRQGIPFMLFCPLHDDKTRYPAIELVSSNMAKLAIGSISSPSQEDGRRSQLEAVEHLEAAFGVITDQSGCVNVALFAWTVPPILTYKFLPALSKAEFRLPLLVFLGYLTGTWLLSTLFPGYVWLMMRCRLVWPIPIKALVRLYSSPYLMWFFYAVYAITFRLLCSFFVDLEEPEPDNIIEFLLEKMKTTKVAFLIIDPPRVVPNDTPPTADFVGVPDRPGRRRRRR